MVTYFKLGWVTACFERKDLLKTAYFKVLTVRNFTVPASSIRVFLESFKKVRLAFHGITEIFHKWTCTYVRKSCFTSRKDDWKNRLQNSPYFCVFKYARAVKRGWKQRARLGRHTPYGRVRLARFARVRLLRHALPIFLLILRKKPTVLQSTERRKTVFTII